MRGEILWVVVWGVNAKDGEKSRRPATEAQRKERIKTEETEHEDSGRQNAR
jgi:hypothetical protein